MSAPINIMVVEDDLIALDLIEKNLKIFFADKPLTIFKADTLEKAIQLNRIRGPMRLTLSDLQLADSAAENTLKHLSHLGENVLVMSGVASGATYRECKRYGARDYIEKPIVMELLVEKVAHLLDRTQPDGNQGEFIEIQRRAQRGIAQRAITPAAVVLSPVSSRWLKVILPATGTVCVILAGVVGFIGGSWRTAQAQGAEKQGTLDRLERIDDNLRDLKQAKKESDVVLRDLQIDVAKLLTKQGLDHHP